jgi:hypothetical protein
VVSVEGQLPPETTWKRWPTNNDTWIVLNGKLTTAAEWAPVFVVTKEFKFVKHAESLTLPAGVSRITIVAAGGHGGRGAYASNNGGAGIQVAAKDIQVGAERDIQVLTAALVSGS